MLYQTTYVIYSTPLVPMAGIGPATSPLPRECSTTEPHGRFRFPKYNYCRLRTLRSNPALLQNPLKLSTKPDVRWSGRRGSNSRHLAWKASALPTELHPHTRQIAGSITPPSQLLVEGEGFEPSYSERTDLQSVAFNHSATPPNRTQDYADISLDCQTYCAIN
jgi:hypothetical protein